MESADKLKIGQQIIIPGIEKLKVETKPVVAAKSTVKIVASRSASSVASSGATVWPARGTITSLYGPRWGKNHYGIDIAAPTGSNVTAFRSGTVVFSGWDSGGYGNLVIIDHGNGLQSYYGHNSQLIVKKGQSVSAGQLIAKVGSTGDSTGPHCHFEVRKNGTPVNPYNYLK
jgi:murein DD-endopeptidase MepM/ murein hydrolase activator NlpD